MCAAWPRTRRAWSPPATPGQGIVCRVLAAQGARRIAFENPSHAEQRRIAARAGLEIVPVAVDEAGIRVEELERADVDAVVLTPPTSTPPARSWPATGARSCSPGCEPAARSPSRTTTTPSTATTGRRSGPSRDEPDRIVYAGSASKTLAPALRLGWLVVPPRLLDAVADEKDLDDCGTARIEQQAFADFLARGELDRHLRRMRAQYRRRRDLLVEALADALPEATVRGIAAGLHATVQLPDGYDEQAILDQARRRRIGLTTMRDFCSQAPVRRRSCSAMAGSPSTPSRPPCASWPRRPG